MLERITDGLEGYAPTLLRVMAGVIFLLHGWSKLQNPDGFVGFVGSLGFPAPVLFGWLVILLETVGGVLLIVGFATRWVALLLAIQMLITTFLIKAQVGLIAPPNQPGVGAELDLMLMAASLAVTILGAGELSVDHNLLRREAGARARELA